MVGSGRFGVRGRGIGAGELLGRLAAAERRERFEALPEVVAEREAFRVGVRRAQLEGRIERGTAGGFYSEADIEHARVALARLDEAAGERMGA